MKYVCEKQGMKENKNKNNNTCNQFSCDEEKDEDEEHHAMLKDTKSSAVAKNDKKYKSKAIESYADEGHHEEACKVAECKGNFKT